MSVLSYQTIRAKCTGANPLIDPFDDKRVKAASYDLTVGSEYKVGGKDGSLTVKGAAFSIPPNEVAFVFAEEKLTMPNDLAASVSICHSLLKRGVILAAQSQIDPGYGGGVVALLYNFSNSAVRVKRGDHLVTIEFRTLDAATTRPYDGNYQRLDHLSKFVQEPIDSSLLSLRREVEGWKSVFYRWMPVMLSAIAVAVAVLTILASAPILRDIFPRKTSDSTATDQMPAGKNKEEKASATLPLLPPPESAKGAHTANHGK